MTARPAPSRPPKHLSPSAKAWWRSVVSSFDLEPHHLRVLQAAAESWDRMQSARAAIQGHGITYEDRFGCPKARPEVAVERDAKVGFLRALRELGLDAIPAPDAPRAPALPGTAGRS